MHETEATSAHYDSQAEGYDRRWRRYLTCTHDAIRARLLPDLGPDDVLLDASCGTGLLGEQILASGVPLKRLILNDASPSMLTVARRRLPEADDRVRFLNQPVESLSLDGQRCTRIVCQSALHNYADQERALGRFGEMLVAGGRVYLLDWDRRGLFRIVNALIRWRARETIRTRSADEAAELLEAHGFEVLDVQRWRCGVWRLFLIVAELKSDGVQG